MEKWSGRILVSEADVTPDVLAAIEDCVDWFADEPSMPTEDFIDRLCKDYGGDDWDIEDYGSAAARLIMRRARKIRRDQQQ